MATTVRTTVRVEVAGMGTVSATHVQAAVEAIDTIEVVVPDAAAGGEAEVQVQPGGAGQVQLLLIRADRYGEEFSYTVDGGAEDVVLDAPQLLIGGALALLGGPPQTITFSNEAATPVTIRILVGRDATA
jgi:hypothetical protein